MARISNNLLLLPYFTPNVSHSLWSSYKIDFLLNGFSNCQPRILDIIFHDYGLRINRLLRHLFDKEVLLWIVILSLEKQIQLQYIAMPRQHLLRTCGESVIVLGQKAYTRTQHIDGRLGKMANKIDKLLIPTSPLIYTIQNQFLSVLSFADDKILFFEDLIETLIPQSAEIFNKIDNLVSIIEMLPRQCDDAMNEFAIVLNQGTIIDWGMAYFIFLLDCLIATFSQWGSNVTADAIDVIDMTEEYGDDNLHEEIKKGGKDEQIAKSSISSSPKSCCSEEASRTDTKSNYKEVLETPSNYEQEPSQDEIKKTGNEEPSMVCPSNEYRTAMKCSYKEILEKGRKESNGKRENITIEENPEEKRDILMNKNDEEAVCEDPILELFESSWHLSPVKGTPMSRSFLQP